MADSNLPGDLSYASIDTALTASSIAYGTYSATGNFILAADYASLIDSGWSEVPRQSGVDDVSTTHYQGVAFYKVVNGVTEVIIANRGSQPGGDGPNYLYDYSTSDVDISKGASVPADASAVNYYKAVVAWIQANITGPVQIIETGHSLGGQEADYVQAEITQGDIPATYTTETVTFNAPGLPNTPAGLNESGIDALNISLLTDPVHTQGALNNAGYGGQSVTIDGGISPYVGAAFGSAFTEIAAFPGFGLIGGLAGYAIVGGDDHRLAQISGYLNVSPALGGVDLGTYQPDQITQGMVEQMQELSAGDYDLAPPGYLATYYQNLFNNAGGSGSTSSTDGNVQETFTSSETGSGEVLTGSEGDTLTVAESDGSAASSDTITLTDNSGDQVVMTSSADGTYIASDTWSNAQGMQGTDAYTANGSSSGKVVYASGGYATYFADGLGNVTWDYYNSQGDLFSSSWLHSDGESGSETLIDNGLTSIPGSSSSYNVPVSYFETVQSPDASYSVLTGTQGNEESTSQYNSSGALVSTSTVQGAGQNYDLTNDTTTTTTDGSGNVETTVRDAAGDLVSQSWVYANGSSKAITYNASGATEETDVNTDKTSDQIYTHGSNYTENFYNSSGALTGDTWVLGDGTSGQDTFNADGSGAGTIEYSSGSSATVTVDSSLDITIDNLNASGTKISEDWWKANGTHGITVYNTDSTYSAYLYEQNGSVVETDYAADGSVALQTTVQAGMLSPDGSELGTIANPDGTYSIDYMNSNGDALVFNVSAGAISSVDHVSTTSNSEFSVTIPGGQSAASPYNEETVPLTGSDGTQYIEYTNVSGTPTGEDWTDPTDGSYGYVTFNADGSSSEITYNSDGTYYTLTKDASGDTVEEDYDASGTLTGDIWTNADGSHGEDTYNSDGSSTGIYYNANGTYSEYADDGQGNITQTDYSSAGVVVGNEWQKADGSYGSEVVNADGSINGSDYQADGSYDTFTIDPAGDELAKFYTASDSLQSQLWSFTDGNGNTITFDFDASGNLLQESWASADGTSETVSGGSGPNLLNSLSATRVNGEAVSGSAAGGVMQVLGNEDTLAASGGSNVLYALGTADSLEGAGGNDTLVALGADATLVGGSGNEVFEVNDPSEVVQAQAGAESNEILSSVSYTLPANVDVLTLVGTGNLSAGGNTDAGNVITGNSGNDSLYAGSGSDTLVSGSGLDTLFGGSGPDTFVVNNSADVIEPATYEGWHDTVESSVSYELTSFVQTLDLVGSGDLSVRADYSGTEIAGNAGNDTLIGESGFDTFVGGTGVDTFEAGGDNNTFVVNNLNDVIQLDSGDDDTVETSMSYTLGQGVDALTLTGTGDLEGQGNADATNLIEGNSGNDTLIAGSVSDTLVAGSGSDTLVTGAGTDVLEGGVGTTTYLLDGGFGATQIEPGSGTGVIEFGAGITPSDLTVGLTTDSDGNPALLIQDGSSSVTVDGGLTGSIGSFDFADGTQLTLPGLLTAATVTPSSVAGANGNAVLDTSAAASLSGGYGDDTVLATGASDTLAAGTGDQYLLGAGDADSITGGFGNDTLVGGGANDTLMAGSGSQVLYALGTADVLTGGMGSDTLYGGAGSDTLVSGTGSTVIYGGSASDTVVLTQGANATFYPGSTSGTELIELPNQMTLADFTAYQGTDGDLILQSLTGSTSAVIKGFYGSSANGKTWLIADSTGAVQLLSNWVDSNSQPPSGYQSEMQELQQAAAADLPGILGQVGEQGGTIAYPGGVVSQTPENEYSFDGVTTDDVSVQGGALNLGSSEDIQSTYTSLQTGSTTYPETIPIYTEVSIPGARSFVPDSSLDSLDQSNMQNAVGSSDGISVEAGTDANGHAGYWVTLLPYTENEQTGTRTIVETVPTYTYYSQETESFTAYNVTGDGGNDVITASGPFVGTVDTGNGNVSLDLGMQNGDQYYYVYPNEPALGAFIDAGSGNDSILGSGGSDTIAAGTGYDFIEAALGSTVYVPLQGTSTEEIDIGLPSYGRGPLPPSTLVLPNGITPEDLNYRLLSYGPTGPNGSDEQAEALQITYGDSSVLINFTAGLPPDTGNVEEMPSGDWSGIDQFQFSDGTVLTRDQILAMAGSAISASDLNPTITALNPTVSADSSIAGDALFSGSDSSGQGITWYQVSNTGTGGGYFTLNGVAQAPGEMFYVSAEQLPQLTYVAGASGTNDDIQVSAFDGLVWGNPTSFNVNPSAAAISQATGANQVVSGPSIGPDTIIGGYGGDTLAGSSGQDTFEYSSGGGAEVISETAPTTATSDNILQFGPGIAESSLSLSAAAGSELVLSIGSGGDSVAIEGFDALNPLQSFPIQSFAFSDGTDLTLLQLLSDSAVTGTSGSITNPDGTTTNYQFTPSGDQIYSAQNVNSAGQWLETVWVNADGSDTVNSYTYNADGTETETELLTPAAGGGGPTSKVLDINSQGQITSVDVTNPDGSTDDSTYTYNADGSQVQTEVETPAGGGAPTTIVYDINSQWQTTAMDITNPDGSTSDRAYVYNADGSQIETDVETPAGGGGSTTTVYDINSQGQRTSIDITNPDGSTDDSAYTFNADGSEVQTEVVTPAGGGGSTTTVYDINSQNHWTSVDVTNPDGSTVDTAYAYNADGSETETEVATPAGGGSSTTSVYDYAADGTLLNYNAYTPGSDGSYHDNWSNADGSYGSYWWNASTLEYQESWYDSNGNSFTDDYQYASGGSPGAAGYSFVETYSAGDGSTGSRQYDASTGEVSLSWDSASTGQLSGTITDSGFIGLENDGELTNTQQDLTFFNPNVSSSFSAFLAAH